MAKGFGVSPITNTIYYGTQDPVKQMWTGKKEDVTDKAIAAVYEWFMGNMKDDMEEYSITYPSTKFELVMRRKQNPKCEVSAIDTEEILQELQNKAIEGDSTFGMFAITEDGQLGEEVKE